MFDVYKPIVARYCCLYTSQHICCDCVYRKITGIFYSVQWVMPQGNYGPRMEQHQKILDAVKVWDSSKAEQAMTEHLEKAWKFLEENFHQPEYSQPTELVR